MKNLKIINVILFLLLVFSSCIFKNKSNEFQKNWPSFRGLNASGIFEKANIPLSWDLNKNKNIKWKTIIPGLGHSSPVIWEDKVFVTTAISENEKEFLNINPASIDPLNDSTIHEFKVYCLDKNTGEIIWDVVSHKGIPKVKRHPKSSHASPTPATDGKHLVVFFGSEGLYCYSFKGELLWKKDLGVLDANFFMAPEAQWGFASSPVIYKDRVIVQCDVSDKCFLASFNIHTGEEIWRTERDDYPTWSTPTILKNGRSTQIVVNGFKQIGGYDFETGKLIWWMKGGGDIPIPTPVVFKDMIFINSAHGPESPIYAISIKAKGDISLQTDSNSNEYVKWSIKHGGSYHQTPLIYNDYLYNLQGNGQLSCFDIHSGNLVYKENLKQKGGFTASGIASDGKLYFPSEEGDIVVVKSGPEFEILAINPLGDICMASPAICKDGIYFRTQHYVVKIADGN